MSPYAVETLRVLFAFMYSCNLMYDSVLLGLLSRTLFSCLGVLSRVLCCFLLHLP